MMICSGLKKIIYPSVNSLTWHTLFDINYFLKYPLQKKTISFFTEINFFSIYLWDLDNDDVCC
jgi:hypothetical protein